MFPFKKNTRVLSITKPSSNELQDSGYIVIPSQLIYCADYGLRPQELTVLLYLLDKKDGWEVVYDHMAKKLGIGYSTCAGYVSTLANAGFIQYQKLSNGKTTWHVTIPEYIYKNDPKVIKAALESARNLSQVESSESLEPNPVLPDVAFPDVVKEAQVIINSSLMIEKTTTVVDSEIILESIKPLEVSLPVEIDLDAAVIVDLPKEINTTAVKRDLSKLSPQQQVLMLQCFFSYIATLKAKNSPFDPVAIARSFAKKALLGELSAPIAKDKPLSPLEKEKLNKQKLVDFFTKNINGLKREFLELKKDYVHVTGLGNITRCDFFDFMKNNGEVCHA